MERETQCDQIRPMTRQGEIDDKLLTALAHVFGPSPPAETQIVACLQHTLSDTCITCCVSTGKHSFANVRGEKYV